MINARIDAFLRKAGSPEEQLRTALDRAARYLAAGADCVYPIGVGDLDLIGTLVKEIGGPVNVGYGQGPTHSPTTQRRASPGSASARWSSATCTASWPEQSSRRSPPTGIPLPNERWTNTPTGPCL